MKKLLSIFLAVAGLMMCFAVSGCGCSNTDVPKDKILIYSGVNGEKGSLLMTIKDTSTKSAEVMEQVFSDVKKTSPADKEETNFAKEIYYVEYLSYDKDGNKADTFTTFIYYLDDKIYCYSPDKQKFSDGEYYLNGYTNVTQEVLNDVINGVTK